MTDLAATLDDLVAANRILAGLGVLDGFGHVSVRHPERPDRYLLSRSLAPEVVTARRHDDLRPRDPNAQDGDDAHGPTSSASSTARSTRGAPT